MIIVAFSRRWMSPTSCDCRAPRPWPTASRSSSLISGLMALNVRVAYLTVPVFVVPFSTLILRDVVMFVRCVAMMILLSIFNGRNEWDRGGLRDSREARRTACWLGGYSLALILLYGIDMSKASGFLEKILTLELTHPGQKLPIIYAPAHTAIASERAHLLRRSNPLRA